ncbi:hypothetical protein GUJ93_ZPchr0003g18670 [Zizania palustris]|uniref:Uncharacterized protein n=1 Tax=Zizania palustris TaxID=103762 RepID=A0A8J5S1B1_ZIZPA|nr:hypothetical protein GUJ93_ZPchr0003g18670 [Zizania palustris]
MNLRPVVLIFLLLVLIITSQFEWKQQVGEAETNPTATRRRQQSLQREDAVKEKIILSQEKNIQQLNELIQSLQLQLLHCRLVSGLLSLKSEPKLASSGCMMRVAFLNGKATGIPRDSQCN